MSINKNYIMAGMLAATVVVPLSDVTDSHASEIRVTTTRVNFRTGAGTNYNSIGVLEKGTKVTYVSETGNWTKVQYNSKTGYICSDYLEKEKSTTTSTSTMYVIPDSGLNVRKGAGTSYALIATLSKGTAVTVHSTSNGWSKITVNRIEGYVSSQYLSSTNPSNSSSDSSNSSSSSNNSSSSNGATSTTSIMYVTPDAGLNVRTGAGTSYSLITKLSKGTAVTVYSTINGWSKIKVNGIEGYVSSQYLSSTNPSNSSSDSSNSSSSSDNSSGSNGTTSTTSTMYVIPDAGLNVRTGAGTSYSLITKLSKGTAVTVYSTINGWSKIKVNGIEGYVSSQYLSSTNPSNSSSDSSNSSSSSGNSSGSSNNSSSSLVNEVLNFAAQQLGKPYIWGGLGPSSFDCSGLTQYVYKNAAGITIPRVSSDQSKYGTTVSKSDLKAGDLIFFDTSGPNNGVVSHVGIYVGNGQMIHASSSNGKVVQVNMETSYWNNAYVTAKRVL